MQPSSSLQISGPSAVVPAGLDGPPFEPLRGEDLRFASLNAASLPALAQSGHVRGAPVASFGSCLAPFCLGKMVRFDLCPSLLRLMASAIDVVHLGRHHMKEFQFWVATRGLVPVRHGAGRALVGAEPSCLGEWSPRTPA